ncbi:MAG: hypothetical protein ACUVQ1_02130 [Candidatus Kapaibacteriales bacterium]
MNFDKVKRVLTISFAIQLITTTFLTSCSLGAETARFTFSEIEKFEISTEIIYRKCKADVFEPSNSVKDLTWDFYNLQQENNNIIIQILHPDSVNESKDYPNSNFTKKSSDSTYIFLREENDKLSVVGFKESTGNTIIKYSKPKLYLKRSISYGEKLTSDYEGTLYASRLNFDIKGMATT